ncbi:MAG TPA: asparagine synthase (glutamine-hydrolyzing) [Nitrospiraceae bacterium]|jgi:asparagine synthase (glutamine-hydrolysing)|nr:asparagine synthase (glutamine-hydrolyzing) [Nitrospiraceae bacterium]
MCGIAGIMSVTGPPVMEEELRAMCAAMIARGPDDEGIYLTQEIGLAMRRLSIIDLHTGHQPVCNEDRSVWVVLNGEIYNYRDLRSELIKRGHEFSTVTDTEVIVHLYEELGDHCVERLRGMFAFALWDVRRRRLLLVRDRLGIKPLYYAIVQGRLLFGSELKAILQIPDVDRTLNWSALDHLLAYKTTPEQDSIVEGVKKLEPGHRLSLSLGSEPKIERYWNVRFEPQIGRSEEDVAEELRAHLLESVKLHMVSDVPVGAFLSGGTDSSAVVAAMSAVGTGCVKTFSIGFRDEGFNELPFARMVADRLGTDHHELILEPDVMEVLTDLAWDLDEPFGDSSAIPTYMVSKMAAQHVKVVLSGDGGDELFAGYTEYVVESRERWARFLPAVARDTLGCLSSAMPVGMRGKNWLHHFSLPGPERYLDAVTLFKRSDRYRVMTREAMAHLVNCSTEQSRIERLKKNGTGHWLSELQSMDLDHYLPLDILTKVDRMSMAHSLEARVPLLDHTFVEFAARIPVGMKLKNGRTKHIFVQALRGLLPDPILDRPKQGFAPPIGSWLRKQLGPLVRDTILSETCRRRGIFDRHAIEALVRNHEQGRPLDFQVWTLISFELWCRTFLDGSVRARPTQSFRPASTTRRSVPQRV